MAILLFAAMILVDIAIAVVIIYHLRTYTINKRLAGHAIVLFVFVTAFLIIAQAVAFAFVPFDLIFAPSVEEAGSFGQPSPF